MARHTGPKCRLCRREGVKLFLKGARCDTPKCAVFRRQQVPGQQGNSRKRPSEYGLQLREKQKVKRIYGVREDQFRRYFGEASKFRGETGKILLVNLERRLDNVIYRAGLSLSRSHARQMVTHRRLKVNDRAIDRPSFLVSVGDKIRLAAEGAKFEVVRGDEVAKWLARDNAGGELVVSRLPERDEIGFDIKEQLIIEFYSR